MFNKFEVELSKRQEKLAELILAARGEVVFWKKKGKVRILDPLEIWVYKKGR